MASDTIFKRAALYYIISPAVLAFYGGEVCPFLDKLKLWELASILYVAYAVFFCVRQFLTRKFVIHGPLLHQPGRQLFVELSVSITCGLVLTAYNTLVYDFPVPSGLKLVLGCVTLGFFLGLDLALNRERKVMETVRETGVRLAPDPDFLSMPRKFAIIVIFGILLVTLVWMLLVVKDVYWIADLGQSGILSGQYYIVLEFVFVAAVLLFLILNFLFSYTRNIRMFFEFETGTLESVAEGELKFSVPVASNDEFGVIANHTNRMIEGLRERDRIRKTFGKVVSPEIAERLLRETDGLKLGGCRQQLTILLSDIRGFTSRSENADPATIVDDLNTYFSEMVRIVREENGIVDKFIGDGMLAVFGLDDPEGSADKAVRAAVRMMRVIGPLNESLSKPIRIGIGIHWGDVIAGNIGSRDRLEFTVIGDTVNTAARLESATKDLSVDIVISDMLFRKLGPDASGLPWEDLGTVSLKGKTKPVSVCGLRVDEIEDS